MPKTKPTPAPDSSVNSSDDETSNVIVDDMETIVAEELGESTVDTPSAPVDAAAVAVSKRNTDNSIVPANSEINKLVNVKNFGDLPYINKIEILTNLAKDPKTGLKSPHNAVMLLEKANELQIGWANAISHMHFIKDKLGIDIHIIKAILNKPGTGISWEKIEDHVPIYQYTDGSAFYNNDKELPSFAKIVKKLPKPDDVDYDPSLMYVVPVPTNVAPAGKTPIWKYVPSDWRTTYKFTRKKKDIDGTWITQVEYGTFSWGEAILAKLPIDAAGELNSNSNWQKYRKLMIATRAFTFGAREIASDLLLGAYETTELYDMMGVNYDAKQIIKED